MPTNEVSGARLRVLAGVLLLGAVVSLLDTTIVSVALETIAAGTGASTATAGWVSSSYLLAMAIAIPLMGWAMDRFGAKTVWMASLSLFLVGSLLCGLAWSVESLIAFRVVKGAGGGLILPLCQAILTQAAGPDRIARALALITVPGQLVPIVGPALGGLIVDSLGWRWIFLLNVPVCALALLAAARLLPAGDGRAGRRLDRTGAALLCSGLALVVYGLSTAAGPTSTGPLERWLVPSVGLLLLAAFVRHARRAREPLLDVRLFNRPTFGASAILMFLSGVAIFGGLYLLPLYYQQVRLTSPLQAGLFLAPQGLGTALALLVGPRLLDRIRAGVLVIIGTIIAVLTTAPFLVFVTTAPSDALLAGALFARGAGIGLAGLAMTTAAYRELRHDEIPRATSMISVLQRLGGSIGTTTLAAVLARQSPTAAGFSTAFLWSCALLVIAVVPAAWLLELPRRPNPAVGATSRSADVIPHRAVRQSRQVIEAGDTRSGRLRWRWGTRRCRRG